LRSTTGYLHIGLTSQPASSRSQRGTELGLRARGHAPIVWRGDADALAMKTRGRDQSPTCSRRTRAKCSHEVEHEKSNISLGSAHDARLYPRDNPTRVRPGETAHLPVSGARDGCPLQGLRSQDGTRLMQPGGRQAQRVTKTALRVTCWSDIS